jgi:type II secretory pathway pseudopilin PulG
LLELLTVIAIIAVLAGLLFPMIKIVLTRAEVAKAQQAVGGLATAFRAYYTEYGKWPDVTVNPPNCTVGNPCNVNTNLFGAANNARGIVFYEFPAKDLDVSGNLVDPWGHPYRCNFDVNYQNSILNPFSGGTPNPINAGLIVWSRGPDGLSSEFGGGGTSANDKDNVVSW